MLKKLQEVVDQIRVLRITAKSRKTPRKSNEAEKGTVSQGRAGGQFTRRNGYKLLRIWDEKRCGWLPRLKS